MNIKRGRRSRCRLSFFFHLLFLFLKFGEFESSDPLMSHSSFPHAVSAWIADPSVATPAQGKIRKRPVHGVAKWLELRLARGLIQSKYIYIYLFILCIIYYIIYNYIYIMMSLVQKCKSQTLGVSRLPPAAIGGPGFATSSLQGDQNVVSFFGNASG